MANPKSRTDVREQFALLLQDLVTNNQASEVFNHLPMTFEGKSPVVTVWSGGTNRRQFGMGTEQYRTPVRIEVAVWVADEDESEPDWDRQDVEDRLDLLEQQIMKIIAENRANSPYWEYIEPADSFTEIVRIAIGGKPYWVEAILVEARMQDGT